VAGPPAACRAPRPAHATQFEADDRLSGHADPHRVDGSDGPLVLTRG